MRLAYRPNGPVSLPSPGHRPGYGSKNDLLGLQARQFANDLTLISANNKANGRAVGPSCECLMPTQADGLGYANGWPFGPRSYCLSPRWADGANDQLEYRTGQLECTGICLVAAEGCPQGSAQP